MSHFLCKTHSKRTFNRNLIENKNKKFKEHLYKTFYFRKTRFECENNIDEILKHVVDESTRDYIKRE